MQQVEYRKEGMQHYLCIPCEEKWLNGYANNLMQYHPIPYFLSYEVRELNDSCELYYRLQYRTTLKNVLGYLTIDRRRMEQIIKSIVCALEMAEEYMICPEQILWKSDYIFIEADTGKLQFCYYPDFDMTNMQKGTVVDLVTELLHVTDRKQEDAMLYLLSFYNLITEGDCSLIRLIRFINMEEIEKLTCFNREDNEEKREKEVPFCNDDESLQDKKMEKKNNKIEVLLKNSVIGIAVINVVGIAFLIFNVFPYSYIAYLMGTMGLMIVLTIVYMNVSKEESPDEIMKSYFEEMEQKKSVAVTSDNISIKKENKWNKENIYDDILENVSNRVISEDIEYGETTLLTHSVEEDATAIVVEEKKGEYVLKSFVKEKYPSMKLDSSVVVGCMRDGCNYIIKEKGISRMHAKLMNKPDGLFVIDLNSTNGTYINGEMIASGEEYRLEEGDLLAFAKYEFLIAREN